MHVTYIGCVLTAVEPCLYLTMSPMCCGKVNQTTWFRTQRQYFSGKCIALHFATKSELAQQHKLSIVHQSKDGFAYAAAGCTKPNTTVKPLGGHRTARNQVDLFSSLNRIESNRMLCGNCKINIISQSNGKRHMDAMVETYRQICKSWYIDAIDVKCS